MTTPLSLDAFFSGHPTLVPLKQRHWWVLAEDWTYHGFTIPAGFLTDFDSIPPIPGVYALFKGRARRSALLHDYHYATGCVSKEVADDFFYRTMLEDGVNRTLAKQMYRAVKWFGGRYYNKFAKLTPAHRIARRLIHKDGYAECLAKPISKG